MQAYYLTGICLSKNLYDAVCGETEMKDYVGELIELVEKDSDPNTACDNFINENETALIIFSSYDEAFKINE